MSATAPIDLARAVSALRRSAPEVGEPLGHALTRAALLEQVLVDIGFLHPSSPLIAYAIASAGMLRTSLEEVAAAATTTQGEL